MCLQEKPASAAKPVRRRLGLAKKAAPSAHAAGQQRQPTAPAGQEASDPDEDADDDDDGGDSGGAGETPRSQRSPSSLLQLPRREARSLPQSPYNADQGCSQGKGQLQQVKYINLALMTSLEQMAQLAVQSLVTVV